MLCVWKTSVLVPRGYHPVSAAPGFDPNQPELMLRRADALLAAEPGALACGPGLGHSGEALRLLEQALKCPLPVVLDADALNLLATDGRLEGNLYNRIAPAVMAKAACPGSSPPPSPARRHWCCAARARPHAPSTA